MAELLPILRDHEATVLCEICPDPGRCCKRFLLLNSEGPVTFWADSWRKDAAAHCVERGHPFEPLEIGDLWRDKETGREYGTVWFGCPKLVNGRCSIYPIRPQLCRDFLPGPESRLCTFGWFNDGSTQESEA